MMKRTILFNRSYCQLLWSRQTDRATLLTVCAKEKNSGSDVSTLNDLLHKVRPRQQLSSVAEARVPNVQAPFRTKESDPTRHNIEHEGLYYDITNADFKKYVYSSQWPVFQKQVMAFQENAVMIRKPALEAMEIIDSLNLNLPPAKILFYGRTGHGKSLSMCHVIHRYAKQNWLIVQLPDMLNLLRYRPTRPREFAPSSFKEGRYDLFQESAEWLEYFKRQNQDHLSNLQATQDYKWSARDSAPIGTSLEEIVDFGIARKKYASDCIGAVLKEIRMAASKKQCKVLVAVDGVNGFWKDTSMLTEQKQKINAQDISLFIHFRKMFEPVWNNGVCIGTVCPSVEALDTKNDSFSLSYMPHTLLKKQGFEFMDPFIPILVPGYSQKEAFNCIEYYIDRKWINKERSQTLEGKKELIAVSGKSPYDLMNLSISW